MVRRSSAAAVGVMNRAHTGLLILVIVGLAGRVGAQVASEGAQTWGDGAPIVRFDKNADVSMTPVADWTGVEEQHWAGPTIWTNRLQDWVVRRDALESVTSRTGLPCRTAHLLTYELSEAPEPFRLSAVIRMAPGSPQGGFAGFLVGAGEGMLDYRAAALVHHMAGRGGGILGVIETSGAGGLAFRDMADAAQGPKHPLIDGQTTVAKEEIRLDYHQMVLNLEGVPAGEGKYDLRLSVWARYAGDLLGAQELRGVDAGRLRGNVALVSDPGTGGLPAHHTFSDFAVGGGRLAHHPERTFGPVAGTLFSLSGRTLKLNAQFMHLGNATLKWSKKTRRRPRMVARLEYRPLGEEGAEWKSAGPPRAISIPDYCVVFRVDGWDSTRDFETRVLYEDAKGREYAYTTIVPKDPVEKPTVSMATFTGMGAMGLNASSGAPKQREGEVVIGRWRPANMWFPFADAVEAVKKQDADILFFTGDQIYEGKPTFTDPSRFPAEDYLYKWLLFHWAFRDLTNHLPSICQADDHDVYHGNLWGWGGRLNTSGVVDTGGYLCSPFFVNVVHKTMTAQNPGPSDRAPCLNGISNYYGGFNYGGIGFAVLEDRKFKTPPQIRDPAEQVLLGEKQLQFLDEWGEDWTGAKMKVVVSQTGYASMHVGFNGALAKDPDSGGFPKVGRDRAVRLFRKAGALVVCGDQHLATFTRLGVDAPSDAVYQMCVPAMGNIFWRWFYPKVPGEDRAEGEPEYLGEFVDAWGNYMRMVAVANPERKGLLSQRLRSRYRIPASEAASGMGDSVRTCKGEGYGIVRFHKDTQSVTIECWPHDADPTKGGKQFAGWPIELRLEDLDGRKPVAWLPDLSIRGLPDAVVQTVDESTGEVVKTTRARDGRCRPGVFEAKGRYTLRVGEPGSRKGMKEFKGIKASKKPGSKVIKVRF